MRKILWTLLLVLGCGTNVFSTKPEVNPISASKEQIELGVKYADLIVLAVADSMEPEQIMASSISMGPTDAWWNIRVTVDSTAKGKLSSAKYMDYDLVPRWLQPPKPFKLADNQIMIQSASRWQTAPVNIGQQAIYFFKKCYHCVKMPARTDKSYTASPWFAVLTLVPEQWPLVKEVVREHS